MSKRIYSPKPHVYRQSGEWHVMFRTDWPWHWHVGSGATPRAAWEHMETAIRCRTMLNLLGFSVIKEANHD